MKDLYDKIERYLTGELSTEERKTFEQEMKANTDLAAEVQLHQKMASVFEDPQDFQIREGLQQAADSFQWPEEKKIVARTGNIRYLYWAAAAAAVLAGVIFFFSQPQPNTDRPMADQQPSIDTSITPPPPSDALAQDNTTPETPNTEQHSPAETPQETTPANPDPPVTPPVEPSAPDLLASNTELEESIAAFEIPKGYDLGLDVKAKQNDGQAQLDLFGELYTAQLSEDDVLILKVYDNNPENYPNKPVLNNVLALTKSEEEQPIAFAAGQLYGLLLLEDLPVYPAKYYYVISVAETDQTIAMGIVE